MSKNTQYGTNIALIRKIMSGHREPYFLQNINDKIKTVIFIITNAHLVLLTSKDSGLVLHICPPDREGMVGISVSAYSLCQLPAHFLP